MQAQLCILKFIARIECADKTCLCRPGHLPMSDAYGSLDLLVLQQRSTVINMLVHGYYSQS